MRDIFEKEKGNMNLKKPLILRMRNFLLSRFPRFRERIELPVFHIDDTEDILRQFGLWENFRDNKIKCSLCSHVVTKQNLKCILSEKGEIKLVCDELACVDLLLQKYREGQNKYGP